MSVIHCYNRIVETRQNLCQAALNSILLIGLEHVSWEIEAL